MTDTFINKLVEVQKLLKAPKSQYNSFGKYHYRSAEDIIEAVKPLLHERGLFMSITDTMIEVGGRVYLEAKVYVQDTETGASHFVRGLAREALEKKGMDDSQITGATSSYARKYALNGMFAIDDTKDSDATNDHGKAAKPDKKPAGRMADDPDIQADLKAGGYDANAVYDSIIEELNTCSDSDTLKLWVARNKESRRVNGLPSDMQQDIKERHASMKTYFESQGK